SASLRQRRSARRVPVAGCARPRSGRTGRRMPARSASGAILRLRPLNLLAPLLLEPASFRPRQIPPPARSVLTIGSQRSHKWGSEGDQPMTFRFDRFRFDVENGRLESACGPIPLNPKALDVLRVLVARRGHLVLKDQLLDEVWPDTHVADGVLKVRMAEIRSALGDSARQPRV